MHVIEALKTRRAVKHFDPTHRLTDQEIKDILELAMLSPTAFNLQHWRFVVVTDPNLRQQIREKAWGQAQVTEASILIILTADLKVWEKNPHQYWKDVPETAQKIILPAIDNYYRGKERVQRDEVMRSCGIVAQSLMLIAQEKGLDSCPMDGFDFDAVASLINLPKDHVIAQFVAMGKKAQDGWPRPVRRPLETVLIQNRFPPEVP